MDEQVGASGTRTAACETKRSRAGLAHASCSLLVGSRRPDDWTLSAGGSGTIYGWGHNHRGQLGGIEGAKVKVPTPCEALATLRPVQLIGGEQTLFSVTADGKVRGHFLGRGR